MKRATVVKLMILALPLGIPILLTYEAVKLLRKKRKEEKDARDKQAGNES